MPQNEATNDFEIDMHIQAIEHWTKLIKHMSMNLHRPFDRYDINDAAMTNTLTHGYMWYLAEGERALREAAFMMKKREDIHLEEERGKRKWWR